VTELADRIAGLVRESRDRFPELDLLRPGGELRLDLGGRAVERVRVELTPLVVLQLQSLGLETVEGLAPRELAAIATVTASSWGAPGEEAFDAARLFDADHPAGVAFRSSYEEAPWLEVVLARPVELTALRLRSVASRAASAHRDLRISVAGPGEDLVPVHDAAERGEQLMAFLTEHADRDEPELTAALEPLGLALTGRYPQARRALTDARHVLTPDLARAFRAVTNEGFLLERSLEWTTHGPLRSFRFWSHDEKVAYVRFAVEIADALADLTPNVAFGFGAALAAVRDHDLIPHDDDLDLIIAFEPHEATSLPAAHTRLEEFLRERGFTVSGDFFSHRHVGRAGSKKVDVFCGLFEGDRVSWYPGVRRGLSRDTMFPTTRTELLGVEVPLPAQPEEYLATIYGTGWNSSDPGFKHSWKKRDWLDLGVPAADDEPAAPARRSWLDRLRRR